MREAVGRVCFDGLDFRKADVFQPVELTECSTWDAAYLAGDGKTVKPAPGRAGEYVQFLENYRADLAQFGLTFEEPAKKKEDGDGS